MSGAGRRGSRYLAARIPAVVAAAPGGGMSRAELAAACRVRESERVFALSLTACYRQGQVDFCAGYVVAPPPQSSPVQEEGPRSWHAATDHQRST